MEFEPDLKTENNARAERSSIFYKPRESGTWVKLDDSREMPSEFVAVFQPRKGVDEPFVEMHFAVIDGVPQCRVISISAIKGKRELRASDLRALPVEVILENVAAQIAEEITRDERGNVVKAVKRPYVEEWMRGGISAVRSARRQGKRKVTDDLLREVAQIYRENVNDSPTLAIAAHFGVADRTARLYVRRARDAGFLGESIKGKAGER